MENAEEIQPFGQEEFLEGLKIAIKMKLQEMSDEEKRSMHENDGKGRVMVCHSL
jgi:hypothetical protein